MAKIKKAFEPIVTLLEANPGAKVKDILDQVREMASAKAGAGGGKASTFHKVNGTVIGIFDYYHKKWFDPRVVEFGTKSNSPTGLNTMCKDGANKWSKQQRELKALDETLLQEVIAGELKPGNVEAERAKRAEQITAIKPLDGEFEGYGFDNLEDLLTDSKKRGLPVDEKDVPEQVEGAVASHDEH